MQVTSVLRYARISPQKCRLVADVVRGKPVGNAIATLKYMPKKGADLVRKLLESAVANAEHNHGADVVRGKPVGNAIATLKFMPKKGADLVRKLLESAVANAEHNHGADVDDLKVSLIHVDAAPVLKRFAARAKGRGARIVKRNSHITVGVSDGKKD